MSALFYLRKDCKYLIFLKRDCALVKCIIHVCWSVLMHSHDAQHFHTSPLASTHRWGPLPDTAALAAAAAVAAARVAATDEGASDYAFTVQDEDDFLPHHRVITQPVGAGSSAEQQQQQHMHAIARSNGVMGSKSDGLRGEVGERRREDEPVGSPVHSRVRRKAWGPERGGMVGQRVGREMERDREGRGEQGSGNEEAEEDERRVDRWVVCCFVCL